MAAISYLRRNQPHDIPNDTVAPTQGATIAPIPISRLLVQRSRTGLTLCTSPMIHAAGTADDKYDNLFSMLADEIAVPSWLTPLSEEFPKSAVDEAFSPLVERFYPRPRSVSPVEDSESSDSDSDSVSDISSEGSWRSSGEASSPASSSGSLPTPLVTPRITITPPPSACKTTTPIPTKPKAHTQTTTPQTRRVFITRREKSWIDTTKKKVEEYDMGKVGVLTGGVMLGGTANSGAKVSPKPATKPSKVDLLTVPSWRRPAVPTPTPTSTPTPPPLSEVKVGRLSIPAWRRGARS